MNELAEVELAIMTVRGQRVMLSNDLAHLYGVEPRTLMQAVKRNIARFPADFMFHLNSDDLETMRSHVSSPAEATPAPDDLKSQIVIPSWGGRRYDSQFRSVFEAIRQLTPPDPAKNSIGFTAKIRSKDRMS
ncbi:MAG: ORF6N domain-containing protein [Candidatus Accumulibacter sp.]|jgi:hypothetical protein|nr:ORF6N domain-containing protein [Accumulibacter sp.]